MTLVFRVLNRTTAGLRRSGKTNKATPKMRVALVCFDNQELVIRRNHS